MSNSAVLSAKKYAREKQFRWAAATFERIINQESRGSAEAAYCLGIMHHTGSGVPENVYEATRYYLNVKQYGHPMAIYRLGFIYHARRELQKTYDSFRSLGPTITRIPQDVVQLALGVLLLLFGVRWLRKAILRSAGDHTPA